MTERPKPYIGVSGVVNIEQQHYLIEQFISQGLDRERYLALGVKAVHKTQFLDIENKYGPEWYPVGGNSFSSALEPYGDTLRVAQVYLDTELVGDTEYRKEFTKRICRRGAAWLNALQFDMLPWHENPEILPFLEQLKQQTGLKILLQAHGETMRTLGPDGIARALGRYAHALDYILFDASHGKGVRLNPSALLPFLHATYGSEELDGTAFGIAGGLNAEVVYENLPNLLAEYPDVSWDAEGQLHPVNENGTCPLDMQIVTRYLGASAEVLRSV